MSQRSLGRPGPLRLVGVAVAVVSAVVHLVLGVGFLPHPMGVAFLVATAGFAVGIAAVLTGRDDRRLHAVGVPFVAGQVVLWYLLNRPTIETLGIADVVDKVAQLVLLAVLVILVTREE